MAQTKEKSVFATLYAIDCREQAEKKNGLTYLSWAWAWAKVKKEYPEATYKVYETAEGVNYFTDGRSCWVKTGVTIEGLEHIEQLPVMDFRNNAIPFAAVKSTDVNKAIQRSLTKACARHGLGLYIYAGEDLPEEMGLDLKAQQQAQAQQTAQQQPVQQQPVQQQAVQQPAQPVQQPVRTAARKSTAKKAAAPVETVPTEAVPPTITPEQKAAVKKWLAENEGKCKAYLDYFQAATIDEINDSNLLRVYYKNLSQKV